VAAVLAAPGAGNEDAPILEDASDVDEPVTSVLTASGADNEDAPILEVASDVDESVASGPRGRLLERDSSPHSSRRRSRAARTPPSTPDLAC
jgi:hypothetical protein